MLLSFDSHIGAWLLPMLQAAPVTHFKHAWILPYRCRDTREPPAIETQKPVWLMTLASFIGKSVRK